MLATMATAGLWPVLACAAEFPSPADSDHPASRATLQSSTAVRSPGFKPGRYALASLPPAEAREAPLSEPAYGSQDRLRFGYERATGEFRLDEYRYGLAARNENGLARSFVISNVPPRLGWGWSGRLGPLRWLGDADGDVQLRLGGRLPGQPQMSGMGSINIAFHYTFE